MPDATRVLIVDDNQWFCDVLRLSLDEDPDFDVVGIANDGLEALKMVGRFLPDILILDIIMPYLDGLGVLERLPQLRLEKMPRVIVLSGMGQDSVASMALQLGADYFMVKPVDVELLKQRALQLMREHDVGLARSTRDRRDHMVVSLLGQISMSPRIQGYQYLREAVCLVSADVSLMRGITNRLYAILAEKFASTPVRVERSIRHAIETTVNKGNMEALYRFFGNTVDPQKGKPTNGEFIAMLAEYVRMGIK